MAVINGSYLLLFASAMAFALNPSNVNGDSLSLRIHSEETGGERVKEVFKIDVLDGYNVFNDSRVAPRTLNDIINNYYRKRIGSVIALERDISLFGVDLIFSASRYEIEAGYTGTINRQSSGGVSDYDHFGCTECTSRSDRFDPTRGRIIDSAYGRDLDWRDVVYFDNYSIINEGRGEIDEHGVHIQFSFFTRSPRQESEDDPPKGFYLFSGLNYSGSRYAYKNSVNFIPSDYPAPQSLMYLPGEGIIINAFRTEIPFGIGYRGTLKSVVVDGAFGLLVGRDYERDFHVYRMINFVSSLYGTGFQYRLSIEYDMGSGYAVGLAFNGHRFFSTPSYYHNTMATSGVMSQTSPTELMYQKFFTYQPYDLGIKEGGVEFYALRRFSR